MVMSASFAHLVSATSWQRTGSQPHTLSASSAPPMSARPSSEKTARRTCDCSTGVWQTGWNVSRSHSRIVRSVDADASRNSAGWIASAAIAPLCWSNSWTRRPIVRSHTLTRPSSPPEITQRPSGEKRIWRTAREWPRYVWMHERWRMSQILRLVSTEPDAKNSPYGCHCTPTQFERWPVSVRATLPASRSHSLSVPPDEPAITVCSSRSKVTHSIADVWPASDMMAVGLPTDQMFTFLSSPPVASTAALRRPTDKQLTAAPCATNSCVFVAFWRTW